MALGDGTTWDETLPTDSTTAVSIDDHIRDVRKGIRSRLALEHEFPTSQSATSEAGVHKFITLQNQAAKPTLAGTQVGAVYAKTSALFFEDSAGVEIQITTGTAVAGLPTLSFSQASTTVAIAVGATWADLTGMTVTMTGSGSYLVWAQVPWYAANTYPSFAISIDSTRTSIGFVSNPPDSSNYLMCSMNWGAVLTNSAHTFTIQGSGGGNVNAATNATVALTVLRIA